MFDQIGFTFNMLSIEIICGVITIPSLSPPIRVVDMEDKTILSPCFTPSETK